MAKNETLLRGEVTADPVGAQQDTTTDSYTPGIFKRIEHAKAATQLDLYRRIAPGIRIDVYSEYQSLRKSSMPCKGYLNILYSNNAMEPG